MLNREKYVKELADIAIDSNLIAIVNGRPKSCLKTPCEKCDFHNNCFYDKKVRWANSEYVEPPVDWTKVPVDTPILVRDYEGDTWKKRYFARYEDNKVCAWANGCASWNADGTACWTFAKLAEREE